MIASPGTWIPVIAIAALAGCQSPARGTGGKDDRPANRPASRRLTVFDFTRSGGLGAWEVEDDVVMGGRSSGALAISPEGHGVFSGQVSLENNGGFSSIQLFFEPMDIAPYRTACLRLRGDGKRYQFLGEAEKNARHYYVYEFSTTGDWQTVEVPLAEMVPVRRGDRLAIPNFPGKTLAQVRFFIANGKPESFRLEIDKVWLK